jgi:hypothetical protein
MKTIQDILGEFDDFICRNGSYIIDNYAIEEIKRFIQVSFEEYRDGLVKEIIKYHKSDISSDLPPNEIAYRTYNNRILDEILKTIKG